MKQQITTNDFSETENIGQEFTEELQAGDVVLLKGDLGSGKTTFVKGVAKGFGIQSRIISPTFVLMRTHSVTDHPEIQTLYHIDLYRVKDHEKVSGFDFSEALEDKKGIVFIEWPNLKEKYLDKTTWSIAFEHGDENIRKIIIERRSYENKH